MTFQESGLSFSFPDDWLVKKYDQHRFYRYVSGYGLKGVDFIIITPVQRLILLEVKNYFNRFANAKISPTIAIRDQPLAYAKKFAGKFEDSFSLIRGIHQYYHHRHRFRWLINPVMQYLPKGLQMKTDWGFWTLAFELLEKQQTELILWLELNESLLTDGPKPIDKVIRKHIVTTIEVDNFSIHRISQNNTAIKASMQQIQVD